MASEARTGSSIMLAAALAVLTAVAWWWHARVFRTQPIEVQGESWDRVKEAYPLPGELSQRSPTVSSDLVDAVVHANPFSPERRLKPAPILDATASGGAGTTQQPPAPTFAYKGRVNMGKRQRAIVEDTANHKTYFLEVGQEVAGFKLLDIAENRVVLSDPQTHEEVVVSLTPTAVPAPGQAQESGVAAQAGRP